MRVAARCTWIACWLACICANASRAQPSLEPSTTSPASDDRAPAAGRSAAVFLLPAIDAETEARLRDALLAQFSVVDVRLVLEPGPAADDAAERTAMMQARAQVHDAIAAFSIDVRADGRWALYMLDVERERLLVRTLDAGAERRTAAIEAIALMTREATRALLEGAPMPEPPPEPPEPASQHVAPKPAPAEPPPPPQVTGVPPIRHQSAGEVRLWLAYDGTNFADEVGPRHSLGLGAGWLGLDPWYAALSVELGPPIEVDQVEANHRVGFQIRRLPLRLHLGHRYQQERVVLDLEVAVTAELLHRSSDENQPAADGVQFEPRSERNDWLAGVGPRARVEYQFLRWAGFAAELGFDALMNTNNFEYLVRTPERDVTVVRPLPVRPCWSVGVAFYP